jgi:hypothetical protein
MERTNLENKSCHGRPICWKHSLLLWQEQLSQRSSYPYLAKTWIESRLKESIKHEYDQKIELFKKELEEKQLQKQKIELVSELIAEWMACPAGVPFAKEYRTRLNRLSFQASLWLPSALAVELSKRLQNLPDAKSSWELILFARRLLTQDESLEVKDITFWGSEFEKPQVAPMPTQQP